MLGEEFFFILSGQGKINKFKNDGWHFIRFKHQDERSEREKINKFTCTVTVEIDAGNVLFRHWYTGMTDQQGEQRTNCYFEN